MRGLKFWAKSNSGVSHLHLFSLATILFMFNSGYFLIVMMTQMETEMFDDYHLNYHISATQKILEKKVTEFGLE